jgi:hypothetical protein
MSYNYVTTSTGGTTVINTLLSPLSYQTSLDSDMRVQDLNDFESYLDELTRLFELSANSKKPKRHKDLGFYMSGLKFMSTKMYF